MKLNLQHARPAGQAQLAKATQASRRASVLPPQAAAQTENKNSVRQPRPENISGDFYVDHTCIGALLGPIACLYASDVDKLVPFGLTHVTFTASPMKTTLLFLETTACLFE